MMDLDVSLVRCSNAAPPSRLPGLDRSVNPYRGCAHSCAYCYAQDVTRLRTSQAWGSFVDVKVNIVPKLKKELERGLKGVYGVGTVTDPYQPLERKHRLTRGCLSHLKRFGASTSILTKSDLVLRDLDILRDWSSVEVGMSVACTDEHIAAIVEPGAPPPKARFEALSALADAEVDIYLMAAPIIPELSDSPSQLESLVESAAEAGVRRIMWDSWNSKPLATVRLRDAVERSSMRVDLSRRGIDDATLSELRSLCRRNGVDLIDAF